MKVTYFPNKLTKRKTTLVLGSFESIHNGHVELINEAKKMKLPVSIMLIENVQDLPSHKGEVYASLDIRLQQLSDIGVDFTIVVKYTPKVANTDGIKFLSKIKESVNAQTTVSGSDFKLGKGASLIASDIKDNTVVPLLKISNKKVSTSFLKELIPLGEVDLIKAMSPYFYTFKGRIKNDGSLASKEMIEFHRGIYAAYVIVNGVRYGALIYKNMKNKIAIEVQNIRIENQNYDAQVQLVKLIRKVFKTSDDEVRDVDFDEVNIELNKR